MYRFCCFSLLVLCWNCKLLLHFLSGFEPIRGLIDDHPLGVMKGKKPFASKSWSVCICIVYGSFQVLIQCLDRFNTENYIFWLFFYWSWPGTYMLLLHFLFRFKLIGAHYHVGMMKERHHLRKNHEVFVFA